MSGRAWWGFVRASCVASSFSGCDMPYSKHRPPIYEVGFIFLVSPKGHSIYTLTNNQKEPYIHSPIRKRNLIYTHQ